MVFSRPGLLIKGILSFLCSSNCELLEVRDCLICLFILYTSYHCSVQFSRSVVSSYLWPHGPQHIRPPCPSLATRVYSNSSPLSWWCHPTISSSVVPFSSRLQSYPASGSFSNESALHIRWPKYWSFSFNISPSNEHSALISFWMDWLDLLAVQGTLKSLLQYHSPKASILRCSAFFLVQLSYPHMTIGKTIALMRWSWVVKIFVQFFCVFLPPFLNVYLNIFCFC